MKRIITALVVALALVSSASAGKNDGRLDVYWVDVEGGAATLIVTPAGETVLIDTGNPGPRDSDRIFKAVTRDGTDITDTPVDLNGPDGLSGLTLVLTPGASVRFNSQFSCSMAPNESRLPRCRWSIMPHRSGGFWGWAGCNWVRE